jgi:very-short-patch-repair endonuclease
MPIRSRWADQLKELPNQSKFHNKVREILVMDNLLRGFKCYQEVPVRDLCTDYPSIHFFDWYIEELNMVIELHGAQHYKVVNRGGISYEAAQAEFKGIQSRDKQKKTAALAAGYDYLEISYKEYAKLNAAKLKKLLFGAST